MYSINWTEEKYSMVIHPDFKWKPTPLQLAAFDLVWRKIKSGEGDEMVAKPQPGWNEQPYPDSELSITIASKAKVSNPTRKGYLAPGQNWSCVNKRKATPETTEMYMEITLKNICSLFCSRLGNYQSFNMTYSELGELLMGWCILRLTFGPAYKPFLPQLHRFEVTTRPQSEWIALAKARPYVKDKKAAGMLAFQSRFQEVIVSFLTQPEWNRHTLTLSKRLPICVHMGGLTPKRVSQLYAISNEMLRHPPTCWELSDRTLKVLALLAPRHARPKHSSRNKDWLYFIGQYTPMIEEFTESARETAERFEKVFQGIVAQPNGRNLVHNHQFSFMIRSWIRKYPKINIEKELREFEDYSSIWVDVYNLLDGVEGEKVDLSTWRIIHSSDPNQTEPIYVTLTQDVRVFQEHSVALNKIWGNHVCSASGTYGSTISKATNAGIIGFYQNEPAMVGVLDRGCIIDYAFESRNRHSDDVWLASLKANLETRTSVPVSSITYSKQGMLAHMVREALPHWKEIIRLPRVAFIQHIDEVLSVIDSPSNNPTWIETRWDSNQKCFFLSTVVPTPEDEMPF